MHSFRLFIDADASPVRVEAIRIAERHKIKTFIVSNGGILPSRSQLTETVTVNQGPDEADNWIVDNIKKFDIVITSDIHLADRCIKKDVLVISQNGEPINKNNVGSKLASRNLMADIRSANPYLFGKGTVFSKNDRIKFMNSLEKEIQTIKKSR